MKRRPKSSLSPLQHKMILRFVVLLAAVSCLWLIFAPNTGIYSALKKRSSLQELQEEIYELEKQNSVLRAQVKRIQTDVDYLEEVAREKHGLLKENEMVFDFSPKKKNEKKTSK